MKHVKGIKKANKNKAEEEDTDPTEEDTDPTEEDPNT